MDYVVGSVAGLISGNVTPNGPRLVKRAFTPIKHQRSPNVTPKSEFVDDRSIFLSPTLQKRKAIVKKSPKRIFQSPDLDVTSDGNEKQAAISPKVEKIKKHLKDDLDADKPMPSSPKSPKKNKNQNTNPVEIGTPSKKALLRIASELQVENENTPKKNKKKRNSISVPVEEERSDKENIAGMEVVSNVEDSGKKSKKKRKSSNFIVETIVSENQESPVTNDEATSPKKKRKHKKSETEINIMSNEDENMNRDETESTIEPQNNNKNKIKKNKPKRELPNQSNETKKENNEKHNPEQKKKKKRNIVNPNAITNQETDSEHESDDEIHSENEDINKKILDPGTMDDSSDEEDVVEDKPQKKGKNEVPNRDLEEEVRRTLFVGNVPFSSKCKKELKKIFNKYGTIESIRIRTVPVKDARFTPKVALIKNELHPDRSTVNVYVKFRDVTSVDEALAENNTVLNDHKLRVTRSDSTGEARDPKRAIFVGNLPFAMEDDALREKFENCGEIESVRIVRDRQTNAGKGFGYVNFTSKDAVELALAMSEEDLTIKNRILRVKRCTQATAKQINQNKPGQFNRETSRRDLNRPGKFNQERPNTFARPGKQNQFRGRQNMAQGGRPGHFQGRSDGNQWNPKDGAYRRIADKRKNEESPNGPPNKQAKNINQPKREKKQRKEFVGVTAEKKKKQKFNKGQKKKKALSEILTKHM